MPMAARKKESKEAEKISEGERINAHVNNIFDGEGTYYNEIARMLGGKGNVDRLAEALNKTGEIDPLEARRDLFEFLYIYGGSKKAYSELKGILNSEEGAEAPMEIKKRLEKLREGGITTLGIMSSPQRKDERGKEILAGLNISVESKVAIHAYESPEWGQAKKAAEPQKAVAEKQPEESKILSLELKAPKTLEPELDERKDLAVVTGRGGQGVTVSSDGKYAKVNVFGKTVTIGFVPDAKITEARTNGNETYIKFTKENEVSGKVETSVAYMKAEETEKPRLFGLMKDRQQTLTLKFETPDGKLFESKHDITAKPLVIEGSLKRMPVAVQIDTKEGRSFSITG
jgi:hypothetical protein